MNVNKTSIATLVASVLIALPLSMNVASAETAKTENKNLVLLDQTPTGSIQRVDTGSTCDPDNPNAGAICKITGGNPNSKFPSAPISNFGF